MKTRLTALLMGLLLTAGMSVYADQTITVTANDSDISANLDLKAVATIFGEADNLEDFEKALNDPEARISNLDLNGDGEVDYLRVIETEKDNAHLVVLQAVLAKDIYQDVASIFVEKDPATQQVTVQIVGDEYIYGANYVIEPIYVTVPVIYSWFWGPHWVAWHSPYYWGYYPPYWHPYHYWAVNDYWHHIYDFHHHHPYCSYRYRPAPPPHYHDVPRPQSRRDYATRYPENSFSSRNAGRQVSNARDVQPTRSSASGSRSAVSASRGSRTFDSQNVRSSATRVSGAAATTSRSASASRSTTASATRSSSASASRSTATASRSTSSSSVSRGSSAPSRSSSSVSTSRSSAPSRSSSSVSSSAPSRSSSSSVSRSSSSSTSRSSSSSSVSRSSSYGGSRSSGSAGSAPRSSGSSSRSTSSTPRR